ncbi:DNA ligase D [Rhizobium grahamii]|uniref:DNA ligase (ATP) n=1 Tax=Rhizobium grahamii CCGE 502 TaxID=990285 RepID=S3HI69_9HYPH|nr:DNA ligase D [Rhizobium grahamii]EPE97770.1 ATP-dependent DNA ligase [Rhizobium grahamii CCGE 502]
MALEAYQAKRNFKVTPEPSGSRRSTRSAAPATLSFVIQKHDASRLHYDFRLELDGVLKSWAVTRGPSLNPDEKRLAVHVEDHPLDYGDFEGTIPKGQYGGGTVLLWDRGTWTPNGDPHKGYKKGHLEFDLEGEKLSGRWHLVRMHGKPGEKQENWLLIKAEDEDARRKGDILKQRPESVKSGRKIEEVTKHPDATWDSRPKGASKPAAKTVSTRAKPQRRDWPKGSEKAAMPDFVEPELAKLKAKAPSSKGWIHEIKFDGYRLQVRLENGKAVLLTRSGLDWTEKFGREIADAFAALPARSAILDGEIVVERENGASDFSALQSDLSERRHDRFVFYAFDLLYLDGYDLRQAKVTDRKRLLEALLAGDAGMIRYSQHFTESGTVVLEHARQLGLEGIVSKLADSEYVSGRTGDWVKSKCLERQEFVIGGYVPSTAMKNAIGSLAMGVYRKGKLAHVGRVGTGFSVNVAQELYRTLSAMEQKDNSFDDDLTTEERRGLVYVTPKLVAEVEFQAWSADGNLRHAAFRGLREDKAPEDVMPELINIPARELPQSSVTLTHPDRIYWPDEGVTKQGLASYYARVWRFIEPYVTKRPLALLRCPDGIAGHQRFFQKHSWKGMNPNIEQITDPKDKGGEKLLRIMDFDGMVALVQSAVLEIHPWGATTDSWERPDMITMDLDPADGVSWSDIIAAANELKKRLEAAGLAAFVKTSGGKGLHVVTPLKPKASWVEVKAFAKALADGMSKDQPDKYLATATKAKRTGKIFIDYLRNGRGNTAVAAYSTRARPGAAVSMPLEWTELTEEIGPAYFTVDNAPARLDGLRSDPWADFFAAAVPLEKQK